MRATEIVEAHYLEAIATVTLANVFSSTRPRDKPKALATQATEMCRTMDLTEIATGHTAIELDAMLLKI